MFEVLLRFRVVVFEEDRVVSGDSISHAQIVES
jgi:hypothetical protein